MKNSKNQKINTLRQSKKRFEDAIEEVLERHGEVFKKLAISEGLEKDHNMKTVNQKRLEQAMRNELTMAGTKIERPKNVDWLKVIKSETGPYCAVGNVWYECLDEDEKMRRVEWLILEVERLHEKCANMYYNGANP